MSFESTFGLLLLAALFQSAASACSGKFVYVLTFAFDWSFETDLGFPTTDPSIIPGFSNVICAAHASNYTMWEPGAILSQPMIDFIGTKHVTKPLDIQLAEGKGNGTVHSFNKTEEGASSLGELTLRLPVQSTHTLISCASRIQPSPSWFIGISSLELCQNSSFVTDREVVLLGWWGGLDEAEEYNENKPLDLKNGTKPFKVRRRIDVAPFGYGTLCISRQSRDSPLLSTTEDEKTCPKDDMTNNPRIVPAAEAICVDAKMLRHLPRHALVYPTNRYAHVLCDPFDTCATPGHMVTFHGQPMMMKSYCDLESSCERRVIPVNSPKYSRAMRIDTHTENLQFTAFAAQFSTQAEERMLSTAVHLGL